MVLLEELPQEAHSVICWSGETAVVIGERPSDRFWASLLLPTWALLLEPIVSMPMACMLSWCVQRILIFRERELVQKESWRIDTDTERERERERKKERETATTRAPVRRIAAGEISSVICTR